MKACQRKRLTLIAGVCNKRHTQGISSTPDKVRFEINQYNLSDYSMASQFLNINQTDIVSCSTEYGLFGGAAGSHLLKLLGDLRMPVATTLHTVLKDPAPRYRAVMGKLSELF